MFVQFWSRSTKQQAVKSRSWFKNQFPHRYHLGWLDSSLAKKKNEHKTEQFREACFYLPFSSNSNV